jgi:predicted ArsR family transcriptional regulator
MATPEDARRANRSLLLRTLHRNGPVSRAGLAKVTGLTRATVSAVVRDLMDDEVVEELGLSTTGGVGKPATLVDVAADGRHVLCLDLSEPARFVGAVVDLAGKVVVRRTYDRKDRTGRA